MTVKYITKPIYIVALFSAAAASRIMQKFGVIIDNHMIRKTTQTTPAGAGHLMTAARWTRPCRMTTCSTLCLG
ncbi:phosphoethanolamine transferase domain-containing protein [Hoeflea alexandrii]|uniref:phosphoethanolamine transferase domain-containing protein n=1 Tax=Hoeflea alexandrii TaxID=288436 RepID=UPI0035D0FD4B